MNREPFVYVVTKTTKNTYCPDETAVVWAGTDKDAALAFVESKSEKDKWLYDVTEWQGSEWNDVR